MTPILETLKRRMENGEKIPCLEVVGIIDDAIAERDALKTRLAETSRLRKLEEATYGLQRVTIAKAKERISELEEKVKSTAKYHLTNEFVPIERLRAVEYDLASAIRKGNAMAEHLTAKWQEAEAILDKCKKLLRAVVSNSFTPVYCEDVEGVNWFTARRELFSPAPATSEPPLLSGAERIAQERRRQTDVEGWDSSHDSQHVYRELVWAAIAYAAAPEHAYRVHNGEKFDAWPMDWYPECDKREEHSEIHRLEIAGALIAAEIDRLQSDEAYYRELFPAPATTERGLPVGRAAGRQGGSDREGARR